MHPAAQIERLKAELASTQTALLRLQTEHADARARLALISKIVRSDRAASRAPGVTLGAIRAALFANTEHIRQVNQRVSTDRL